MAGNALIGALKVALGIDTAQFQNGLKKAQTSLNKFGSAASIGFKAVAAGAALAGAAMGLAVEKAIDHADALSKSAQKAGVTTEALSRLAYAADFSDVSLEGLTGGLQKLSRAMADATTTKTSTAAFAFRALGISVTDASGRLRGSDAVFSDISDRFARMEDGATKTALAMQIFGKSGAEMIPLLNGGSAELKRMADEADRLGITLSTKTGKDAERFNDTLTLIGKVLEGVTNRVMEVALPALQSLANTLASPEFAAAAQTLATNIVAALDWVAQRTIEVTDLLRGLGTFLNEGNNKDIFGNTKPPSELALAKGRFNAKKSLTDALANGNMSTPDAGFFAGIFGGATRPTGAATTTPFDPITFGALNAKKSLIDLTENAGKFSDSAREMAAAVGDSLGNAFSRLADAVMSGNDALQATVDVLMDLGKQLVSSAITGFFGNLFSGALAGGVGLGGGGIGRGVYGGNGGFFPGFPGFASGTNFAPGGPAWVGENGPELVNLPRGSQVIPNHALGGDHISVSVVTEVRDGNLVPVMTRVAGQVAGRTVQQQAPAVVAQARRNKVIG